MFFAFNAWKLFRCWRSMHRTTNRFRLLFCFQKMKVDELDASKKIWQIYRPTDSYFHQILLVSGVMRNEDICDCRLWTGLRVMTKYHRNYFKQQTVAVKIWICCWIIFYEVMAVNDDFLSFTFTFFGGWTVITLICYYELGPSCLNKATSFCGSQF